MTTRNALWRCPRCGQKFVTRNLPHSCAVRELDAHFADAAYNVRAAIEVGMDPSQPRGPVGGRD